MQNDIIGATDRILVTGAAGFVGRHVVAELLRRGYRRVRCLVRTAADPEWVGAIAAAHPESEVQIVHGNLLNPEDCQLAATGVRVVYHLAAGREKSFAGSFVNSALGTRNLLDALRENKDLLRFVCVSSFAVYSNRRIKRGGPLDETCPIEDDPQARHEPYTFGKIKQEQILLEYCNRYRIAYVIVRPGNVFGPGKAELPGRIGIDTFGCFLHLGGHNLVPYTYVENCAEAIVLAGLRAGVDSETFNVVDDDLPTSAQFLRWYKQQARRFRSIRVPYPVTRLLCSLWEWYSRWSDGQLPPAFNSRSCETFWKGNTYPNSKLKTRLGWEPRVSFGDAAATYFEWVRQRKSK